MFYPNSFHRHLKPCLLASAAILSTSAPALAQQVETVTVTAERLAEARNGIQTQTGASTYTITAKDIDNQPGGENTQLNQVILQAPGVAQDSFGQLHVRGEHNGLQYRLNGIILPEGISVFGQTLDPRLAESVKLITGALPAEYGNRTAGIIDMQTKTRPVRRRAARSASMAAATARSRRASTMAARRRQLQLFRLGRLHHQHAGHRIAGRQQPIPLHDRTKQYHGFAFLQDILDQNSSVTADPRHLERHVPDSQFSAGFSRAAWTALSAWDRRIPAAAIIVLKANGQTAFPSASIWTSASARSRITAFSAICARTGALDFQVSLFGRYSSLYLHAGRQCRRSALQRHRADRLQARRGLWRAGGRRLASGRQPHHPLRRCSIRPTIIVSNTSSLVLADGGRRSQAIPTPIRSAPIPAKPARPRTRRSTIARQRHQACLELRPLCPGRMEDVLRA